MSKILSQNECEHEILRFGSGDYYVFCTDCLRTWVKMKPGSMDQAYAGDLNMNVQGQERTKQK